MIDCPHCAERLGILAMVRRRCGRCSLPTSSKRAASPELRRALATRPLHLRWLALGLVATVGLSLFPTFGVLQLVVMTPLQLWCIDKATADFTEHLPPRSMLTFELASGAMFMALAVGESALGFFLETLSVPFSVAAFIAAYFGCRGVALTLASRARDHLGPGRIATFFLGVLGLWLVLPPALLVVIALNASGAALDQSSANPWVAMADLVVVGGVASADLFLMPLWIAAGFAFFGIAEVAPGFEWIESGWFLAATSAFVLTEAVVDNALDRRRRFSRTTWPAIQRTMSPATLLFLVWALGGDMPLVHRLGALAGAVVSGDVFRRVTGHAKNATSFFPGATLAVRRARLHLIPKLLFQACAVAALESWLRPRTKLVVFALSLLAALGLLAMSWVGRRTIRGDRRLTCACGTRVKRRAHLCWTCKRPLANTLASTHPPAIREVFSAAALHAGIPASTLDRLDLPIVERLDESTLRERCSHLDRAAARDMLAIVAASENVDASALANLARLVAGSRSFARMLLEEV